MRDRLIITDNWLHHMRDNNEHLEPNKCACACAADVIIFCDEVEWLRKQLRKLQLEKVARNNLIRQLETFKKICDSHTLATKKKVRHER